MGDVFLSYAREDRDTASRLVTALQANGWSVWWDARITTGQEFPLAIQRKLAHDGLFAGYFICNARDAIALETVPHVLRLPDVLAFIRLPRINGQALHTIAKDKSVMREYAHRLAFCRNPRAKGPELDGYMASLSSTDWNAIARDRNASQRAREQARRLSSKAHA
jgi:hypothetical protein